MASNDIEIVIGANDQASKVIDRVSAKVGSFGASLGSTFTGLNQGLELFTKGLSSIDFLTSSVVDSFTKIDSLVDVARGLGDSVGNLQAFTFAMEEAGNVDADKSIASLQKLQRIVGDIARGQNAAGLELFRRLQLDADKLALQGPVDQFIALQDAIGGIENVSERSSIATAILGKSAADLIPALIANRDGFLDSMQAARDMGLAVDDVAANSVANMNDAIGRLEKRFEGFANTIATSVAPTIDASLSAILDKLNQGADGDMLKERIEGAAKGAGNAWDFLDYLDPGKFLTPQGSSEMADKLFGSEGTDLTIAREIALAEERAQAAANEMQAKNESKIETESILEAEQKVTQEIERQAKLLEMEVTRKERLAQTSIESLERQLSIALLGEQAAREIEQLETATNDAERERIANLQAQLHILDEQAAVKNEIERIEAESARLQEARLRDVERQREKDEEVAKRWLDEQDRKDAALNAMPPELQATESRLLTRGPNPAADKAQTTREKQLQAQEKANAKLDRLIDDNRNPNQLQVEVIA